jgi:hypothetical protein
MGAWIGPAKIKRSVGMAAKMEDVLDVWTNVLSEIADVKGHVYYSAMMTTGTDVLNSPNLM